MRSIYRTLILSIVLLCAVTGHAKTVSDSRYNYTVEIPEDFIGDSGMAAINRDTLYAFRRPGDGSRGNQCIVIVKQILPLDPHRAKQSEVPAGVDATLFSLPWKDVNIDCIREGEKVGSDQIVTYRARIPLAEQEIVIEVIGKAAESDQLRTLLTEVVATVDGEINPNDPAVVERRASVSHNQSAWVTATLLAISACLLIGWVIVRHMRANPGRHSIDQPATT